MKTKSLLKHAYSMYGYRKSEEIELSPRKLIKRDIRSIAVGDVEFRNSMFELGVSLLADKVEKTAYEPLSDFLVNKEEHSNG